MRWDEVKIGNVYRVYGNTTDANDFRIVSLTDTTYGWKNIHNNVGYDAVAKAINGAAKWILVKQKIKNYPPAFT